MKSYFKLLNNAEILPADDPSRGNLLGYVIYQKDIENEKDKEFYTSYINLYKIINKSLKEYNLTYDDKSIANIFLEPGRNKIIKYCKSEMDIPEFEIVNRFEKLGYFI